ncbi:tumor necrosis factor ligand superfamily member 4 isoform 2-T2 [Theristicus caerulescens]
MSGGRSKRGKGRDQGSLRRNQCGKTDGKGDKRDCLDACLAVPCDRSLWHVLSAYQPLFSCFPGEGPCWVCTGVYGGGNASDGRGTVGPSSCCAGTAAAGETRVQPRNDEVPWTHIRYTGDSTEGVAVNLTAEVGSIQIRNGSIMITCDGLYLVSLKGNIIFLDPEKKEDSLKLTLRKTDNKTSMALWEQTVQDSGDAVHFTTVLYLFAQDNVTLWTSSKARIANLSFSLVLLGPFSCSL